MSEVVRAVFEDQETFQAVRGPNDSHVKLIQRKLAVSIAIRGGECAITGDDFATSLAKNVLEQLYHVGQKGYPVYKSDVARAVQILSADGDADLASVWLDTILISGTKARIAPKNPNQKRYVEEIRANDVVFGVGPAGTGKTYLAMAMAIAQHAKNRYKRIVLTRPAVEAGERLGFLPGDLAEKVNPYLRPLYDALHDMMDFDKAQKLIERRVIEVAPLAFMRGRTLNDSFVILDEAQNATIEQMRMFLTRLGYNSRAVITGDVTQTDLDPRRKSGLAHALEILEGIEGIGRVQFTDRDVVRHPLVQKIIVAYELADERRKQDEERQRSGPGDQRHRESD